MRRLRTAIVVVALCSSGLALADPIDLALDNLVLRPFVVANRFDATAASSAGFELVEISKEQGSRQTGPVARFELFRSDTLYFFEVGGADRMVSCVGWTRTCHQGDMDLIAGAMLGAFSQQYGFPDDAVSQSDLQAVGWSDQERGVRLEILRQTVGEGSSDIDLSVVFRKIPPAP